VTRTLKRLQGGCGLHPLPFTLISLPAPIIVLLLVVVERFNKGLLDKAVSLEDAPG